MTIKTFNTGRQYSEHGQRIAYKKVAASGEHAVVAMVDVDRGINYMLNVAYPFTEAEVMLAYDNGQTLISMWMDQDLEKELHAAASAHGAPKPVLVETDFASLELHVLQQMLKTLAGTAAYLLDALIEATEDFDEDDCISDEECDQYRDQISQAKQLTKS